MKKTLATIKNKHYPVFVEKGEGAFYTVECPLFRGCYTQGKTLDEALLNIKEVIEMCLEEKKNKSLASLYDGREMSLHSVTL